MSEKISIPGPAEPNCLLRGMVLEVECARRTHRFLCDVFAQTNPESPSTNGKGGAAQLSPDGRSAVFPMANTQIHFETAKSFKQSVGGRKVGIRVLIRDINNVKKVLERHGIEYTFGSWEELPGRPNWIQFDDLDGYTWNVAELVKI